MDYGALVRLQTCLTPLVASVVVTALMACGRSAEPVVACPAPSDDCAVLLEQQAGVEAVYAGAAVDGDSAAAAVRAESGACVQVLVGRSLELGCVEPCAELCRLHPCPVLSAEGAIVVGDTACIDRCAEVSADVAVGQSLGVAIDRAAEEPGLCTCRGCASPDDALCTGLFDCAP
jgi:hypothetical protein